jgi:NAD(P)-dependent dehydrogenase (short-subunit alcohol dehydrogenase family)
MTGELQGKVAIVTGGASGIGAGIVKLFVKEGAKVVIADVDQALGESLAGELGASAAFLKTDVADAAQVRALVDHAVSKFGGLNVMVNNAGISGARHPGLLAEDFADFQRVMGINLLGVMLGTRDAARHMSAHGGGSIINVSSIGGITPGTGLWAYNSSKAAVIHFSKSAALEVGPHGIRVNVIAPGNIETPIMARAFASDQSPEEQAKTIEKIRAFLIARTPMQVQGVPEDTAQAALFFASDRSRFVTANLMPVDGGIVAGSPPSTNGFRATVTPAKA